MCCQQPAWVRSGPLTTDDLLPRRLHRGEHRAHLVKVFTKRAVLAAMQAAR
jgi:hypothetical protein